MKGNATDIIVIGGGEHARVVMDAIRLQPEKWNLLGFTDSQPCKETEERCNVSCLGTDMDIKELLLKNRDCKVIAGIGAVNIREKIVKSIRRAGLSDGRWATVIHPDSCVAADAKIAHGVVVLGKVIINTGAEIGAHSIINSASILEHDVKIGEYSHVASGAIIGGGAIVGKNSFIGLGTRMRDHVKIGNNVTVGAGSVVVTDIPDRETVAGIPARKLSSSQHGTLNIDDICINPETSLYQAMAVLAKTGETVVLVVDKTKKLLGILTNGDARNALLKHTDINLPVKHFMNTDFIAASASTPRIIALQQMQALGKTVMPIVDRNKKVVGLHFMFDFIGCINLPNIVLIMAGGKGKRLEPITKEIPKPMVRVAGRPILEHIILHLVNSGIKNIYIAVNYLSEMIENYFEDGKSYGCSIKYLREKEPLGTAGALSLLPLKPQDPILLINGDLVTQFDVESLLYHHNKSKNKLTIGVRELRINIPYGVLELDQDRVVGMEEKPEKSFVINTGIYVLNPSLIPRIPKNREFSIDTLINACIKRKEKVGRYFVEGDWLDIGHYHDLIQARGI